MLPENLEKFKEVLRGGVNLIPVGSRKKPLFAWKHYQTKRITEEQFEEWANLEDTCGFAAVGGEISGGLVILDFDVEGFYENWCAMVGEIAKSLPTQKTNERPLSGLVLIIPACWKQKVSLRSG